MFSSIFHREELCQVTMVAILVMTAIHQSSQDCHHTNLPPTTDLGADLVCIQSGGSQTRLFVNVTPSGLVHQLGIRNFDNFLSFDLTNMNEVPCCELQQDLLNFDEEDNPYNEWLVRSTHLPDVCNESVCVVDCDGAENCTQCDFSVCQDPSFYAELLTRPVEEFSYTYIRAALGDIITHTTFMETTVTNDFTQTDAVATTTASSTVIIDDDDNEQNYRLKRSISENNHDDDISQKIVADLDIAHDDDAERHYRRRRSISKEETGIAKVVVFEKYTVSGSAGRLPYPARRVHMCLFAQPGVCACRVSNDTHAEITTCCPPDAPKWFRKVPVFIFKASHFVLLFRSGDLYVKGSPNMLPSVTLQNLDTDECSSFEFRARAVVPSARSLALESSVVEHYFLALEKCPALVHGGLDMVYDDSEILREGARLKISKSKQFSKVVIPGECFN